MISFFASIEFTIIASVIILLCPFVLRKKHDRGSLQNITVSLGILGTFIGIFAGLQNFDVNEINQGIPLLLGGLKTAFLTSIAGSLAALLVKLTNIYGIDEVDLSSTEKDETTLMLEELMLIRKAIAGEDDSTVVTQIQKLRTSQSDKLDDLKKSFDEFAKLMAENNMKALIDAVNKVMEDFNAKINDQLGENFKRLSEATENLVIWQDKYREQLTISAEAITKAGDALTISSDSMSKITERAQNFDHTANQLKESLEIMGASMTGLKNLADTLDTSGKQIQNEMRELTQNNIKELGENLKGLSQKLVEDYSYIQKMMQTVISKKDQ